MNLTPAGIKTSIVSTFHHPFVDHHASSTEIVGAFLEEQVGRNSSFNHRSGKWKIFDFNCHSASGLQPSRCQLIL